MCLEPCFEKFECLKEYPVYMDGTNIARFRFNKNKKPVLNDILSLINYLLEKLAFDRTNIHCICDPNLKYEIDKPIEYQALLSEGLIIEAPKTSDEFILSFALKHDFCFIISNDRFRDYINQLPSRRWLEDRRVSFMFLGNDICLSPNIDYDKINLLTVESKKVNNEEDFNQERTTFDVLNDIEHSGEDFNLF